MDTLKNEYELIELSDYEEHLSNLIAACNNNDLLVIENLFSGVFIYENEDDEFLKDVCEMILLMDTSNEIKSKVCFEVGIYFEQITYTQLAKTYFDKAIAFQKKLSNSSNLTLAMILMHTKNYNDAIIEFNKCDLNNRDTAMFLVNCYMLEKDYHNAIKILTTYLKTDAKKPDFYLINRKIGFCYLYLNEFDIAEQYLLKANLINDIHLLIDVSNYYLSINDLERTLKMYYYMFDLGEGSVITKIEELEKKIKN